MLFVAHLRVGDRKNGKVLLLRCLAERKTKLAGAFKRKIELRCTCRIVRSVTRRRHNIDESRISACIQNKTAVFAGRRKIATIRNNDA